MSNPDDANARAAVIETAVKFLQSPKVRESTVERQRAFLTEKGMSAAEIDAAFARLEAPAASTRVFVPAPPPAPAPRTWGDTFSSILLGVGCLIGVAKLYEMYAGPVVAPPPQTQNAEADTVGKQLADLQALVKGLVTSVAEGHAEQKEALSALNSRVAAVESTAAKSGSLGDIRLELTSLKSLLLGRNSFPALQSPAPSASIPTWQKIRPAATATSSPQAAPVAPVAPTALPATPSPVPTDPPAAENATAAMLATTSSAPVTPQRIVSPDHATVVVVVAGAE